MSGILIHSPSGEFLGEVVMSPESADDKRRRLAREEWLAVLAKGMEQRAKMPPEPKSEDDQGYW